MSNAKALQALGNELDFATFPLGVMDAYGAAYGFQFLATGNALLGVAFLHEADAQHLVVGFAHALEGFLPGVLVNHNWLHLGGEERPVRHRQYVHAAGHLLFWQYQAFAVLVLADVLGQVFFGSIKRVVAVVVVHAVHASSREFDPGCRPGPIAYVTAKGIISRQVWRFTVWELRGRQNLEFRLSAPTTNNNPLMTFQENTFRCPP